jgi:carbamoyl-phosphate synthase small subunit
MEKLKYGHRGGNQPVMNLLTGSVEITAQNHGFGLVFESSARSSPSFPAGFRAPATCGSGWTEKIAPVVESNEVRPHPLTHVNLNDGTCEGIQFWTCPVFSVQYHPEASPARHDSALPVHRVLASDGRPRRLPGHRYPKDRLACSRTSSEKEVA